MWNLELENVIGVCCRRRQGPRPEVGRVVPEGTLRCRSVLLNARGHADGASNLVQKASRSFETADPT